MNAQSSAAENNQKLKQNKQTSTGFEWIGKMCYIHTVALLFSHEKDCSIDNHDCMDQPQSITQTKKSRAQKIMNCTTQFVEIY